MSFRPTEASFKSNPSAIPFGFRRSRRSQSNKKAANLSASGVLFKLRVEVKRTRQ